MTNQLLHKDEFQTVLKNYTLSDAGKAILAGTKLVILLAPSSTGRNTIIRELLKTDKYYFIISDTTRRPRVNDGVLEQNGVEYWFRSEEEVLRDLKNSGYLEAEVIHDQQVSGISLREFENATKQHKIAITDIDIAGVENILKAKPDTTGILVLPPSFEEWQRRLRARGALDPEEVKRRIDTADKILATSKDLKLDVVINDYLEKAVDYVRQVAESGTKLPFEGSKAETVVNDIRRGINELRAAS